MSFFHQGFERDTISEGVFFRVEFFGSFFDVDSMIL